MKFVLFAGLLVACASAVRSDLNPLGKVIDLLSDLEAKVIQEGETEAKAYEEYVEWCDDTSKNGRFAIETATKQKAKLEASIQKLTSDIDVADSKVADLAAAISQADSQVKNATLIRDKEKADFAASETELMEIVDTLSRAVRVLEQEMTKNPALAQVDASNTNSLVQALGAVLDAASFTNADQHKLASFAQSMQRSDEQDADAEFGAPAVAAYKSHSTGILDVLEDMKEKAESQLASLRKAEVNTAHNFAMLKQSLEDQLAVNNKDMSDEKSAKASAQESKATAEGDLEVTEKDLAESKKQLETAHASCMQTAADHEATMLSRTEELKVIAEAKKILKETGSGAVSQSYSFVQVNSVRRLAGSGIAAMVKKMAQKHHSAALAQLASRIGSALRFGNFAGDEPFAKIKGLITDMISKLEAEMGAEATEKAYCDEQMSKTEEKKAELEEDVARMTSKIDKASSRSAELTVQIKELQAELAALTKEQAEMDKIRVETHKDFEVAQADLELGLNGVRKALGVLREYYGGGAEEAAAMLQDGVSLRDAMMQPAAPVKHSKAGGAGTNILGILEVVESDFAKNLAKEQTEEEDAQSEYEKMTQENEVTKTTKEQDVKYKTQESKTLDKTVSEISSDRETSNTELAAVLEYYGKIRERCIAKPETYESRKQKREDEIAGLKEAMRVLEEETAPVFIQRKRQGSFRGTLAVGL